MKTRILALVLVALLTTPALARFVVLDVNFNNRTAGDPLGRGGAFQGEPVTGPFDMGDEFIVSEGAGDMAVEFPDARILGPSELYFAVRDRMSLVDGKLTVRWTVTPQIAESYEISLRSDDLENGEFFRVIFDGSALFWTDADNNLDSFFGVYLSGMTMDFTIEMDLNAGTYDFYYGNIAVVTDEPHGVTGLGIGSLVFTHPDDGNATGSLVIDDIQLDWRPGDAPWLLDANFSNKSSGEVIDTRGAFYGEPVSFFGGAHPYVAIGAPLGNKALVFEDGSANSARGASFEFFGGVEPRDHPVSISFVFQVDQTGRYDFSIREQGGAANVFLTIKLNHAGDALYSDNNSGAAAYFSHSYQAGVPTTVEMTFEPVLDLYSVWWNGARVVHRRAHGVVGEEVGRVAFGTGNDLDLDGTLYVDRIRAHTLGVPVGVDDTITPAAPAILLGAAPNPFNPATEIRFELPSAGPVTLDVFDGRGRLVRRLVDESLPAGLHRPVWRGLDQQGRRVASGVYHARVTAGGVGAATSLTLIK